MAPRKTRQSGKKRATKRTNRPRRRGARAARGGGGVIGAVHRARAAAASALKELQGEISAAEKRLETLLAAERDFLIELGGRVAGAAGGRKSSGRSAGGRQGGRKRSPARRKGPSKADSFFPKLPGEFSLEDVRKVAGRLSGVSLAQWSRAKKIRKVGGGRYQKTAAGVAAAQPKKK